MPERPVDGIVGEVLGLLARRMGLRLWLLTRPGFAPVAVDLAPGSPPDSAVPDEVTDWAAEVCGVVGAGGEAVAIPDVRGHPALDEMAGVGDLEVGAILAVPIPVGDEQGWICGIHPYPVSAYHVADRELVTVQANLLGRLWRLEQASDRARLDAVEAKELSHRDGLTGVANRAGWDAAIDLVAQRCQEQNHAASILVIDLDDLKELNDRYGHAHGDQQLRSLAQSIVKTARADDTVARLGGDEFGLLAPGTTRGTTDRLVDRLHDQIESRGLNASIGAAECPPGGDLREAWRRADLDMYATKRFKKASHTDTARVGPAADPTPEFLAAVHTLVSTPVRLIRALRSPRTDPPPTNRAN